LKIVKKISKLPKILNCLPGENDEAVKAVPRLREVAALAEDAHGHHLDDHLDREVRVNYVITNLEKTRTNTFKP
jgi:hypothetical protein